MRDLIYIVDVFSLVFQVFHGIPPMTGPAGQPTNAVFGFTRDLLNILKQKKPTHLVCAMDAPGDGERHRIYPEYKANRIEMPEDLVPQIPMVQEIMRGFHVPDIGHPGWEADDVIATLTRHAVETGLDVVIVTNDKDARQLLGPNVQLFNVRKNVMQGTEFLQGEWGIRPDQVVDFQSLVGDSVDNVPGVPLVGPKKAAALLQKFGTLEEVLAHADEAPGKKLRENLKTFADQARLSRQLVELNQDLPVDVDWDHFRVDPPDETRLLELFHEYGFRRFGEQIRSLLAKPKSSGPKQNSLFPDDETSSPPTAVPVATPLPNRTWQIVDTPEKFDAFLNDLQQQTLFCVDLETTGLDAVQADIVGWAFSWQAGTGYYIPVLGPEGQAKLDPQQVAASLKPILEDPDVQITNQNIKYDMLVMRRIDIHLQGVGMDPMVGSYLIEAGARSHGLDALAEYYLHHRMIPISDLIGTGKKQIKMFEVEIAKVAEYAAEDADIAFQLAEIIGKELEQQGLDELYWKLERPLIPVLVDMEFAGIKVDVEELQRQSAELELRLADLMQQIHGEAGHEFNIDSPLQLRKVLFEELGLPVQKKTKTGASTDQGVLEKLAGMHPLPAMMTEHRHLTKLKGTYLDALPTLVNPETGRIHASFNQVVAATGRLSSSNPNLQNIPIRTAEGKRVRKAFIPSQPGWKLVCADYSQIELRMLAHFSDDPALMAAFAAGADIHTTVAAEIFAVPHEEVDSDKRRVAKAVNFGVIYGQSSYGLSAAIGISQEDASLFIDNYFLQYAGVGTFLEQILDECAATGFARTIMNRRRAIAGIRTERKRQRTMPERTAINTVIQGSAADLIKQAMINVHRRLQREQHAGRMLLQIHDELVFEVPEEHLASLVVLVREEMESAMELKVPLIVDVAVGDNWLDVAAL